MVTVTGTATDAQDLFDKLIAFLTTNATLVGASQDWSEPWSGAAPYLNDRVLEGPGLSGADEILIGMRLYSDDTADEHWIEFRGMTGVIPTGLTYDDHVNVQPIPSRMFIDNDTMDYWFIANGRRFIVVLKISTVFEACYCGFFLPFGTPAEYPYPMFCGASSGFSAGSTAQPESWRDDVPGHSLFPFPNSNVSVVSTAQFRSGVYLLNPDGTWMECSNFNTTTEASLGMSPRGSYVLTTDTFAFSPDHLIAGLTDLWGGGKVLMPIHLFEVSPGRQDFGVLQGVYRCQGLGSSAEDIITVGAVDHLVVQNAFRTDFNDYFAVEI
jgi:hypothetical protein